MIVGFFLWQWLCELFGAITGSGITFLAGLLYLVIMDSLLEWREGKRWDAMPGAWDGARADF